MRFKERIEAVKAIPDRIENGLVGVQIALIMSFLTMAILLLHMGFSRGH